MCLDCGCKEPDNQHGDDRHLTMQHVIDAAEANGTSVEQTLKELENTIQAVRRGKVKSNAWTAPKK